MRFVPISFLIVLSVFTVSCKKEKKPVDPLSYLQLIQNINSSKEKEHSRTQLVSLKSVGNITTLVLAFAMDSKIPQDASKSPSNAYGIRFTLQDSLLRSKRMGGGTFVLKFKKVGNRFSIRNFKKVGNTVVRYPEYSVDSMDTIVNPEIVDIRDTKSNSCLLVGCNGFLTPIKPRVYSITFTFKNIGGDEWSVDHGYLNEIEETKEPSKILNTTASGIKIDFPSTKLKGSIPNYELDKLGVL